LVDLKDISLRIGDVCGLDIDELIRLNIARNHSVEHLIQKALQTVIDPIIRQEGAFKSAQKVTFDFRYAQKLSDEQIIKLQDEVNKYINQATPVDTKLMTLEEAKQFGAIA
jgi:alanyl-tRNA synthetase